MSVPPEVLTELQETGRDLYLAGLVSSHGGNLSVRLADGSIVITKHGGRLGHIDAGELTLVASERAADGEPSMDLAIHRAIYQATGARAVMHAHPRHAIALSLLEDRISPQDLEGRHYMGAAVPVVSAEDVPAALKDHVIVVVRGHGSYAHGDTLWQALQWTSIFEESAQVLCLLRELSASGRTPPI